MVLKSINHIKGWQYLTQLTNQPSRTLTHTCIHVQTKVRLLEAKPSAVMWMIHGPTCVSGQPSPLVGLWLLQGPQAVAFPQTASTPWQLRDTYMYTVYFGLLLWKLHDNDYRRWCHSAFFFFSCVLYLGLHAHTCMYKSKIEKDDKGIHWLIRNVKGRNEQRRKAQWHKLWVWSRDSLMVTLS